MRVSVVFLGFQYAPYGRPVLKSHGHLPKKIQFTKYLSNQFVSTNVIGNDNPKIAIIGAGIGGTSAAYNLRKNFGPSAEINIFELGHIGGRLATVELAGRTYEVGGTVIHPQNKEMRKLVEEMGLQSRNLGQITSYCLHTQQGMVYKSSTLRLIDVSKMAWRYGIFSLIRLHFYIRQLLSNFKLIYSFLDEGRGTATVAELLQRMSKKKIGKEQNEMNKALDDTNVALNDELRKLGMSKVLQDELVMAAVRTNYGQTVTGVHAFVGSVSVAGAEGNLWCVQGGNKQVAERLLFSSGAKFHQAKVEEVVKTDKGQYQLHFQRPLGPPNESNTLFKQGANDGISASFESTTSPSVVETFDIIVIATPMTRDKSTIKLKGLAKEVKFPGNFYRTVATMVHGEINPKFFGFNSIEQMSKVNFFVDPSMNLNSVALEVPVDFQGTEDVPSVWKSFSQRPLSEEELDAMYISRKETRVADWLAYPRYEIHQKDSLGDFELDKNLYFINNIEWAASAMEMSAVGAKNVANLAYKSWGGWQHSETIK